MAEFDWWLLIVGLVLGAGLTWLVVSEARRRDIDVDERERASEVAWIAARLKPGHPTIDAALVDDVLAEHRGYLAAPPPDPERPHRRALGLVDEPGEPEPSDSEPQESKTAASEPAAEDGLAT